MNREIKFRQKTIDGNGNKCFHFWGFMPNGEFITPIISENGTYWTALENSEQYTGLKDKNGKEIYEGDIVKYKHIDFVDAYYEDDYKTSKGNEEMVDEIKFEGGSFYPIPDISHPVDDEYNCTVDWDFEVIGNIYENPGLLNK